MASVQNQQTKHIWSEHLAQWLASGLSQAAYCRKHGVCQQKFSYRKRQSDAFRSGKSEGVSGFAHVQVNPSVSSSSGPGLSLRFNEAICIEGISADNLMPVQSLTSLLR